MTALIVYPRYSASTRRLMHAAQGMGWETLRTAGDVPGDVCERHDEIAIFSTPPLAFQIAAAANRMLLGCPADWMMRLPQTYLLREMSLTTVEQLLDASSGRGLEQGPQFVKPAVRKSFEPGVYSCQQLTEVTKGLTPSLPVHTSEPVTFVDEFRCFVAQGHVQTVSAYRLNGQTLQDYASVLDRHLLDAQTFAQRVLDDSRVSYPPAFVLDVGLIQGRGWAVVEPNECWAAGLYACDPEAVLSVLLQGCVANAVGQHPWDHQRFYQ